MLSSVLPYCNDRRFLSPWTLVIFLVFSLPVFLLIEGGGGGSGPVHFVTVTPLGILERTSYQIR